MKQITRTSALPVLLIVVSCLVMTAPVALSGPSELEDWEQRATVFDVGGEWLTSRSVMSIVTFGEPLVHPLSLTGAAPIMSPGFIGIVDHFGQGLRTSDVNTENASLFINRLDGVSPNPFNPMMTVSFSLAQSGPTLLQVFDVSGRLVQTLINGPMNAGHHAIQWTGRTASGARAGAGVYFVRLAARGFVDRRTIVLLK